ncbi:hypothetical protein IJI91_03325 [Candidatus Saccharibacteria bacterium]|nr:hypothetical protein [Candidatus Saccharibacteria bacterium]
MTNKYEVGEQLQFKIEEADDQRTWSDELVPDCEKIVNADALSAKYWNTALTVIDFWSKYQGRCKLYNTASNPNTKFRVMNVIRKYYNSNINELMRDITQDEQELRRLLEVLDDLCLEANVESISRGWLDTHVTDGKTAASYRGKIKTRIKNLAEPVSLRDLPPYKPKPKKTR